MADENCAPEPGEERLRLELAEERDRYRELLESAHAIVWRGDARTFQFTFVSRQAEALLGYPVQRWVEEPTFWRDHIHPDDRDWAPGFCAKATSELRTHEFDYRMIAADGRIVWFRDVVRVLVENNQPKELAGVMVDITEKKRAEEELRKSEEKYRDLVDLSPDAIYEMDADGRITFANRAGLELIRCDAQELIGTSMGDTYVPEEFALFLERLQKIRTEGPLRFERIFVRKDGTTVPIEASVGFLRNGHFQSVLHDISERKQAENNLRESEARFRILADTAPVLVWMSGTDMLCTFFNKRWIEFTGRTMEQELGNGWAEGVHPEDLDRCLDIYVSCFKARQPFTMEYRLKRADGIYRWVLDSGVPRYTPDAGFAGYIGSCIDITERKDAEDALRRSEAYLAEAQRLSHTGSWAWNPLDRRGLHLSPELYRILGRAPEEGLPAFDTGDLYHPEDWPKLQETLQKAIRGRTDWECDTRLVLRDGSIKYTHVVGHPVLNASGELVEMVGTTVDVTEQQLARAALEEAFAEIKKLKDELYRENLALKEEIDQTSMFEEIIGSSEALRQVLSHVAKVAPTDSTVLITGETGTGKELVARAIHKRSRRSNRAFVSVNCAAIPPTLIASELFGHERGAFTGATQRRLGRFELADGGTIFLDEVGELPAETQIALLRVLQERQFERVGGTQTVSVDARVLAATNRDLKAAVDAGSFRPDLFYRLNVFPIETPSLHQRAEDIPLLVEYFIERYASKVGKKIKNIAKKTLDMFRAYHWPGNIRELQNVIERAVILCDGETFSVDEIWLQRETPEASEPAIPLVAALVDREREMIEAALKESQGRVSGPAGAAVKLGIPRSTLESKIQSLHIDKDRFRSPRRSP